METPDRPPGPRRSRRRVRVSSSRRQTPDIVSIHEGDDQYDYRPPDHYIQSIVDFATANNISYSEATDLFRRAAGHFGVADDGTAYVDDLSGYWAKYISGFIEELGRDRRVRVAWRVGLWAALIVGLAYLRRRVAVPPRHVGRLRKQVR